jgi:hypothetical protein
MPIVESHLPATKTAMLSTSQQQVGVVLAHLTASTATWSPFIIIHDRLAQLVGVPKQVLGPAKLNSQFPRLQMNAGGQGPAAPGPARRRRCRSGRCGRKRSGAPL